MAAQLPDVALSTPVADTPLSAVPESGRRGRGALHSLDIWIPAGFLILMIAACYLWPLVYHMPPPVGGSILAANLPPLSPGHIFGTDPVGNDILSRIFYGGHVSFEVGISTTLIGLVIGGLLGTVAGYRGGATDAVISRVLDVLIAFPSLVLALAIAEALGPSELHTIWALSFYSIPLFGRLAPRPRCRSGSRRSCWRHGCRAPRRAAS